MFFFVFFCFPLKIFRATCAACCTAAFTFFSLLLFVLYIVVLCFFYSCADRERNRAGERERDGGGRR